MALAQRTGRSRHRLVLLALTAITLLTVDLNGFGPAGAVQRVARDIVHPVTSLVSTVVSPIGDVWNSVFNYGDLEDENDALRAEIETLKGEAIRSETDTETLRRLLAATELTYVDDVERVTAGVVRGSIGNFNDHVVTIDKGSRHGIEPGMAVVTAGGMVGRIAEVDNATSTVQLLTDDSLTVGARLVSTDQVGLGHAVAGDATSFLIDQGISWPDSTDTSLLPELGTAVVTAAESRYPADVPIGTIASVRRSIDDETMIVTVDISARISDLHFVTVLLVESPDEFRLQPVVPSDAGIGIDPDLLEPPAEVDE